MDMSVRLSIPPCVEKMCQFLFEVGFKPYIVGGYVRDAFLNRSSKDLDIEVFHCGSIHDLKQCLKSRYIVNEIGESFGICQVRIDDWLIDLALPRTETKISKGHTGFKVDHFSELDIQKASLRRDFTINSMAYDPIQHQLVDPNNGLIDLESKLLRHVSDQFSEDSLRVYRAMQFASRFEFKIDSRTVDLCSKMDLSDLPKERLFEEFKKCFLQSLKPSIGLNYMKPLGILSYFPELKALVGCVQDPEWHPEGDVWDHTMLVVDEMASLLPNIPDNKRLMFMFAALCHDFGKPSTTIFKDGHWRSPGHEKAGVSPTRLFLKRLTDNKSLIKSIIPLVEHHLKPALLYKADTTDGVSDAAIRRLSTKVSILDLFLLAKADHFGRKTPDAIAREFPAGDWLIERSNALDVKDSAPVPFISGKDLISFGYAPGKEMGELLKVLYDEQLSGRVSTKEDAILFLKSYTM